MVGLSIMTLITPAGICFILFVSFLFMGYLGPSSQDLGGTPEIALSLLGSAIVMEIMILALMLGYGIFMMLWIMAGFQEIGITPEALVFQRKIFSWGRPKEYSAEHIKDLRVSPDIFSGGWGKGMDIGLYGGLLAFDYGVKTVRIVAGIDEAEAKQILAAIVARFPQYAAEGAAG